MKTFEFYVDQEVKGTRRTFYKINAETRDLALEALKEDYGLDTDSEVTPYVEIESWSEMLDEYDDGHFTSVYDENDKLVYQEEW